MGKGYYGDIAIDDTVFNPDCLRSSATLPVVPTFPELRAQLRTRLAQALASPHRVLTILGGQAKIYGNILLVQEVSNEILFFSYLYEGVCLSVGLPLCKTVQNHSKL